MPHGYGTCNMPLVLLKSLVYNSTGSSSKIFSENLLYLHIINKLCWLRILHRVLLNEVEVIQEVYHVRSLTSQDWVISFSDFFAGTYTV